MHDLEQLLADWDRMGEQYLPSRRELIDLATSWLVSWDSSPTVVDLGAGPGTLARSVGRRVPTARLIAIDNDPVLRRLHERGPAPPTPVDYVTADLSSPSWVRELPAAPRPRVVWAVQFLHYFSPHRLDELLAELHELLHPGGALVHIDHVAAADEPDRPRRDDAAAPDAAEADAWAQWWAAAAGTVALSEAFVQRNDRSAASAEYHPDERTLDEHLRRAGFGAIVARHRRGPSLLTIVSTVRPAAARSDRHEHAGGQRVGGPSTSRIRSTTSVAAAASKLGSVSSRNRCSSPG